MKIDRAGNRFGWLKTDPTGYGTQLVVVEKVTAKRVRIRALSKTRIYWWRKAARTQLHELACGKTLLIARDRIFLNAPGGGTASSTSTGTG